MSDAVTNVTLVESMSAIEISDCGREKYSNPRRFSVARTAERVDFESVLLDPHMSDNYARILDCDRRADTMVSLRKPVRRRHSTLIDGTHASIQYRSTWRSMQVIRTIRRNYCSG